MEKDKKVNVETGKIVLPSIDVSKYIGKKAKIESADIYEGKEFDGEKGFYVKVLTKVVETIGTGDKKIELRGSKILGLHKDDDGNFGWSDNTKLGQFLNKYKCSKLKDLIGKEVILVTTTSKTGTEFLSFN